MRWAPNAAGRWSEVFFAASAPPAKRLVRLAATADNLRMLEPIVVQAAAGKADLLVPFRWRSSASGYEAVPYFNKYPGRFISLHLADCSRVDNKLVAVGQGVVDGKKLFAATRKAGVKNYVVEVSLDAMKASYPCLQSLKV